MFWRNHILFFQLRRVLWMHWWSLQGSVPPIRLRTTALTSYTPPRNLRFANQLSVPRGERDRRREGGPSLLVLYSCEPTSLCPSNNFFSIFQTIVFKNIFGVFIAILYPLSLTQICNHTACIVCLHVCEALCTPVSWEMLSKYNYYYCRIFC